MVFKMSSPTQSEFEEYLDRSYSFNQEQEEYENYLNTLPNEEPESSNNSDRFERKFESYSEMIDMITYIHMDNEAIRDLQKHIMEATDRLIQIKEETLKKNKKKPCLLCLENKHQCLAINCFCKCCSTRMVSEQNEIKKGKQIMNQEVNVSTHNIYDRLAGINLPYYPDQEGDLYEVTSEGSIQLEICVLHYKEQIETSILEALKKKDLDENDKIILDQIYTILQKP